MIHVLFNAKSKEWASYLLGLLMLLLIPTVGHARVRESRPEPDGVATKVGIGVFVINISKIDDIEQSYTADFALRLSWHDHRLTQKPGTYAIDDVWHPDVVVLNQAGIDKQLDDFVTVDSNANVRYAQRFHGDLTLKLGLGDFPFDEHVLPITFASARYGPQDVEFFPDEYGAGFAEELSLAGWTLDRQIQTSTSAYRTVGRQVELSEFSFKFKATRHAGFYLWRVIVPLVLIIFMSWTVFFIDPNELESQITISVTSILTVVAAQFTFVGILPKVSYLTRLDKFIQGATILIFLALVESVATSAFTIGGKHALARKFDRWSRVIFPVVFVLLLVISFLL